MDSSILLDESTKAEEINFSKIYSRDFLNGAHGIHKYTARMTPPISRYLIEKHSAKGELVFDPFCGSGTTLLEAHLFDRRTIGIDLNPLATLISKVKTTQLDDNKLRTTIKLISDMLQEKEPIKQVYFPNINYWFSPKAINELARIKFCIDEIKDESGEDIHDFLRVAFSSIIRKSSYADLRMAKTYKSKRVIQKIDKGWVPSPINYFKESMNKNAERIFLTFHNRILSYDAVALTGDAIESSTLLKQNSVETVDLVITSPPYINAQDYFRSYKLELWWLGLAQPDEIKLLKRRAIGSENVSNYNCKHMPNSEYPLLKSIVTDVWRKNKSMSKEKAYIIWQYFYNMKKVLQEIHGILKENGVFCLITGNNTICGVNVPTYKIMVQIASDCGFKTIKNYHDQIKNRSLFPGRNHGAGIIKEEWITIFANTSA